MDKKVDGKGETARVKREDKVGQGWLVPGAQGRAGVNRQVVDGG